MTRRWPQLEDDSTPVPAGLQPRAGVEFGCGDASCSQCYEPISDENRERLARIDAGLQVPK